MSIYSGFAIRTQETAYNKTLYNMLCLLQLKIAKSFRQEVFDEELFLKYFKRFYQKLFELEEAKHLPPKFSYALKDLASHFEVFEKPPSRNSPSASSTSSFSFRFKEESLKEPSNKNNSCNVSIVPLDRTVCLSNTSNYSKPSMGGTSKIQIRIPLRRGICRPRPYFSYKNSISGTNNRYRMMAKKRPQTKTVNRSNTTMKSHHNASFQQADQAGVVGSCKKMSIEYFRPENRIKTAGGPTHMNATTLWGRYGLKQWDEKEVSGKYTMINLKSKNGCKSKATCVLGGRFNGIG